MIGRTSLLLSGLLLATTIYGQGPVLEPGEFWAQLRRYHPLALQAELLTGRAEAELLAARGYFDPKLYGDWQQKRFADKEYFRYAEGGMKWTSPLGIEAKLAYKHHTGVFLNPEATLPSDGQAVVGLKVPLLQGMFFNEGLSGLQQGRQELLTSRAEAARQLLQLYYEGMATYWNWSGAYYSVELLESALALSRQRLEWVRASHALGDLPALDTLEAFLQVQTREVELAEARLSAANARTALEVWYWAEEPLPPAVVPAAPAPETGLPADAYPAAALAAHPALEYYRQKYRQLEIERRWKAELRKPRLDLEYNLLGDGFRFGGAGSSDNDLQELLMDNYQLGVQFRLPLWLRKERGGLRLADLKLQEVELQMRQKERELQTQLQQYRQQLETYYRQVADFREAVAGYELLLTREREKFRLGESSLFVLNSREQKWLEARLKLLKLEVQWEKARIALIYTAGELPPGGN